MHYSWEQFYDGNKTDFKGGEITADGQYYVAYCDFENSPFRSIGFSNSTLDSNRLLVEYSTFQNIRSTGDGGAIYFNSKGECCLNRICGIDCNSDNEGKFFHITVSDRSKYKNYFNFSTFSAKYVTFNDKFYSCDQIKGEAVASNDNISDTKCNGPGIHHYDVINSLMIYSIVTCCSGKDIVVFETIHFNGKLKSCNIINNTGPRIIVAWYSDPIVVEDCVIVGNRISPLFYNYFGSLKVNRCYLEDNDEGIAANIDTKNMNTTKFALSLEHWNTKKCEVRVTQKIDTINHNNNLRFNLLEDKIIASCHIIGLNQIGQAQSNSLIPFAFPTSN